MLDKKYIIETTQKIVDGVFKTPVERKIYSLEQRINLRCPYCMEGRTKTKKRGNIYFDRLSYVCFRCGKKTPFDKFLRDFNIQITPDKKLELIEHLNLIDDYSDKQFDIVDTKFDQLIDLDKLTEIFNNGKEKIREFMPIKEESEVYNYLMTRGIKKNMFRDIYQAQYWHTENRYEPIMVFLNRKSNKVLGCQIRNIRDGRMRLFHVYNFESLYKIVTGSDELTMDKNKLTIYNKLSYYFNILNVDFSETITVFEGYLDSLFYTNSIGVVGVETDMSILESSGTTIQYFYDNDVVGYRKSEQKIKSGYKVFLWKKMFNSIVETKKTNDPYSLMCRIQKVKDLNKLNQLTQDAQKKLSLENFFSNDIYDLSFIPKTQKKFTR